MNFEIKRLSAAESRRIDVREWNAEIAAYFRPLAGLEQLVFNDLWLTYNDRKRTLDERFNAAFDAAATALVDENGAALLNDGDRDAIKNASFLPLLRVFNYGLNPNFVDETLKKN